MLSDGKGRLDERTFGLILKLKETNEIKEFLSQHLIREAEFDMDFDKLESLQIRGEIKRDFVTSKQQIFNQSLLEEAVDTTGNKLI